MEELAAARDAVRAIEVEVSAAYKAIGEAKIAADAHLPRCDLVSIGWRSQKTEAAGEMVIVRRTPSGILVTRRPGSESEMKFKWDPLRGSFVDASKRTAWARGVKWDPINDDGDAFRLAVKLGLAVDCRVPEWADAPRTDFTVVLYGPRVKGALTDRCSEDHGSDPAAATRRAIVRAAAALAPTGETKGES